MATGDLFHLAGYKEFESVFVQIYAWGYIYRAVDIKYILVVKSSHQPMFLSKDVHDI